MRHLARQQVPYISIGNRKTCPLGCLHRKSDFSRPFEFKRSRTLGLLRLASEVQPRSRIWLFRLLSSFCIWKYLRGSINQNGICANIVICIFYMTIHILSIASAESETRHRVGLVGRAQIAMLKTAAQTLLT